jgi:hypothetical protein
VSNDRFWCNVADWATNCCVVGSRGGAEVEVYGDAPLLKEPFGDVDTIPVLLTPGPQLKRARIHLCYEVQLPDLHFKFSRQSE